MHTPLIQPYLDKIHVLCIFGYVEFRLFRTSTAEFEITGDYCGSPQCQYLALHILTTNRWEIISKYYFQLVDLYSSEDIIIAEYKSLGCWAETSNWRDPSSRAMALLENQDESLSGDYHLRKQPISKCAEAARKKGFKIFAIQNSGQCFGGRRNVNFRKFGPSERCENGVGGPLANDVYEL